ncbi:Sphingolipid C4-hydroxylase sur2 [Tilletia horrida]|nr:Sphingolipid C4-hydroxylase sur2 [Tilletia horrida]
MNSSTLLKAAASAARSPSTLAAYDFAPAQVTYPFYFANRDHMLPFISDKYLSLLAPILIYWATSLTYHALDVLQLPYFEQYRLHESEEVTKRNKVTVPQVVKMVLVQQAIQTVLGLLVLDGDEVAHAQVFADHRAKIQSLGVSTAQLLASLVGEQRTIQALTALGGAKAIEWLYWWGIPIFQFWFAFFVMDTWQYFMHRAFHESRWLYRTFHSHHHRLYVPYAFGALYNHPLEGLLFDSLGGALSHKAALMTVRQGFLLFTFATFKTVSDHGGYALPWYIDPLHLIFPNTAAYHDVHHQMLGLRYNYSQPFFIHFDVLFGTRMSVDKFKKLVEGKKEKQNRKREEAAEGKEKVAIANGASSALSDDKTAPAVAAAELRSRSRPSLGESDGADLPPSQILQERIEKHGNGHANGSATRANGSSSLPADPLVTVSQQDYRAKAGTSTA